MKLQSNKSCIVIMLILLGCSSSDKNAPTINSVEPSAGEEGDPVTIKGTFLATSKAIHFGETEAIVIDAQSDQVTTQVPAGATEGASSVTVTNEGGASKKADFVVLPKSPDIPTDEKASVTAVFPATSYKGYPVMIKGTNLLKTTKVLFNTKEATIISKYKSTVTVFVPDLTNGTYSIKIVTDENGNSNGQSITIISAPDGFQAPPSANFIAPPPANFTATISNQWTLFLLSTNTGDCSLVDLNDDNFCGHYAFTKDPTTHAVTENYIEFTRDNVEHFYGQWSSQYEIPCTQRIVFISGKDGKVLDATVDVSFTPDCQ